jgi:hypothetical protein
MEIEFEFDTPIEEKKQPKKRRHRATSSEAHESVKEHKAAMYEKIIEGLKKLKVGGHFEEIAKVCELQPAQVWKRLSEMCDSGICFNTGITRVTSSGRKAMVRQLAELNSTTQ